MRKAGIEGKHWHDLRGTAATKLANSSLSHGKIAIWMGWSIDQLEAMLKAYVSKESIALEMRREMNGEQKIQTGDKPGES